MPPTARSHEMRRLPTILIAALLVTGATACDGGEAEETLDAIGETAGEVAEDLGDAVSDAGTEVSELADLVGFCDAARRANEAVEARNAGDALEAAEDLAAEAPEDVASDAETVLEAVRTWHDGDQAAIEDEDFQQAAEDVRAYADEHCDPRS